MGPDTFDFPKGSRSSEKVFQFGGDIACQGLFPTDEPFDDIEVQLASGSQVVHGLVASAQLLKNRMSRWDCSCAVVSRKNA